MSILARNAAEVMHFTRTIQSTKIIAKRAFFWNGPDPSTLGELILDDRFQDEGVIQYGFLFEEMLLLCHTPEDTVEDNGLVTRPSSPRKIRSQTYPTESWDLGPGLRDFASIRVRQAIPTVSVVQITFDDADDGIQSCLQSNVYLPLTSLSFILGFYLIDILWEEDGIRTSTQLNCVCYEQCKQWRESLARLVPESTLSSHIDDSAIDIPDMEEHAEIFGEGL